MDRFMDAFVWTGPVIVSLGWGFRRISKIFTDREFIASAEREGWVHIGTVKFMCVYPIDGGCGMKTDVAYFGQDGLRIEYYQKRNSIPMCVNDRGYIIYSNYVPPTAILNNSYVIRTSDKVKEIRMLWKLLKCSTTILESSFQNRTSIQYLNGSIEVRIPTDLVSNQVKTAYKLTDDRVGGVGYCPQITRKSFNDAERRRLQNSAERFRPNYASFTMVNTKSVKDLKKRTGRSDLSYMNFRPQVVFKGKRPYIEENITALRIGNMQFTNVTPCIRGEDINLHFRPPGTERRGEGIYPNPLEYLTEHRSLSSLEGAAYQNLNGAVFGTNFDSPDPEIVQPALDDEDAIQVDEDEDAIQVDAAAQNETAAQNEALYFSRYIIEGTHIFAKYA